MIGAIWAVKWTNPYTEPPDKKPRVLIQVYRPEGHPEVRGSSPPAEIQRVLDEIGLGNGYGLFWRPVSSPPKQVPPEKLAKIRRRRTERRIQEKYPLFADQFVNEELMKKPDYYAGITDKHLEDARIEVIKSEEREIAELIAAYESQTSSPHETALDEEIGND